MPRKPSLWLVAATGFYDPRQLSAEKPRWQLVSPEPPFPTQVIGVWAPGDAIVAGYGLFPSEDYQECECCGLVLPGEDFADDSAVCCGCVEPSGDALAAKEGEK